MRTINIFLTLVVLTVAAAAQDIQLPDGNVVQGGASPPATQDQAKPQDLPKLPPPPPPPSLQAFGQAGQGTASVNATPSAQAGLTAAQADGDQVAQRAAAAMKAIGADPAKDPELFAKLVSAIQGQKKTGDGQAAAATANGAPIQDAGNSVAGKPAGQAAQPVQPVSEAGQSAAGSQAIAGQQTVAGSQSYCGACSSYPTYSSVVVVPSTPTYYTSSCYSTYYPSFYVQRYSYPVFRSSFSIGFRGSFGHGGGRIVRRG